MTLLVAAFLLGCSAAPQAQQHTPPAVEKGAYYKTFESGDKLAEYLADKSDAGVIISAHRGGPQPGYPENCLETFEKTLEYGPMMIECDVRITRDGYLVLMHDDTLDRTTTGIGPVALETFAEIRKLKLRDNNGKRTEFQVPTLNEALAWAKGKAILSLDVKQEVPFEKLVEAIQQNRAHDRVQVITYSIGALKKAYSLDRSLNHSASADTMGEVQDLFRSGVDLRRVTVFTGVGRIKQDMISALKAKGIRCALGTFGDIDEEAQTKGHSAYFPVYQAGIGIIATDEPWTAVKINGGLAEASAAPPAAPLQTSSSN